MPTIGISVSTIETRPKTKVDRHEKKTDINAIHDQIKYVESIDTPERVSYNKSFSLCLLLPLVSDMFNPITNN